MTIERDDERLAGYVEGVQGLLRRNGRGTVEAQFGRRYVKIVKHWGAQELVHSFVDRENGNVLKARSWRGPEKKHPRSNINDPDYGLSGVEWTGAKYLDQLKRSRA